MANELLQEIACPNCRNPIDVRQHGRHVSCEACSSQFLLQGHLCPNCSNYVEDEKTLCDQCGLPLNRICRSCSTSNWTGDEHCVNCGSPLDILDVLERIGGQATANRLSQQMSESRQLKELEQDASERRMAELMAIEEARQAELKRRIQKQKEQERQLLFLVFAAVVLFLIVLVIFAVISSLG